MAASRRLLRMVLRARFHLIVLATRAVIIPVHATRPTRPVGEYNPLRLRRPGQDAGQWSEASDHDSDLAPGRH